MAWEAFFEAKTRLASRSLEDCFDRKIGTKESSHSSVPILLSIGSGPFTEHAERCSVDAVTPSKARRKHRERMDNRRESQPERSSLRSSHLLRCFMAWEAFFEARTQLESRRLEDRFRQENGDNRIEPFFCPHSFVDWIEAALPSHSASRLGRASSR